MKNYRYLKFSHNTCSRRNTPHIRPKTRLSQDPGPLHLFRWWMELVRFAPLQQHRGLAGEFRHLAKGCTKWLSRLLSPPGLELATTRFEAQRLNHSAITLRLPRHLLAWTPGRPTKLAILNSPCLRVWQINRRGAESNPRPSGRKADSLPLDQLASHKIK